MEWPLTILEKENQPEEVGDERLSLYDLVPVLFCVSVKHSLYTSLVRDFSTCFHKPYNQTIHKMLTDRFSPGDLTIYTCHVQSGVFFQLAKFQMAGLKTKLKCTGNALISSNHTANATCLVTGEWQMPDSAVIFKTTHHDTSVIGRTIVH